MPCSTNRNSLEWRRSVLSIISKVVIAATTLLILFLILIAGAASAAIAALFGPGGVDAGAASCHITGASTNRVSGYSPEQSLNAATIVAVGKQMDVPEYGQVIAIAAALQESGLRNLDHGDRDSLGLFQQRPSQGWGTPTQITNPAYAATTFYRHLLALPDWQQMSLNDAAQTVQRSATPTAYGRHEPAARALTAAVSAATCTPTPTPGPAAAQAIAQLGSKAHSAERGADEVDATMLCPLHPSAWALVRSGAPSIRDPEERGWCCSALAARLRS